MKRPKCKYCGSTALIFIINTEVVETVKGKFEGKNALYACLDCGKVTLIKDKE